MSYAMNGCCAPCDQGLPCVSLGLAESISTEVAGVQIEEGRAFHVLTPQSAQWLLEELAQGSASVAPGAGLSIAGEAAPAGTVIVGEQGSGATAWVHQQVSDGHGILVIEDEYGGGERLILIPTRSADVAERFAAPGKPGAVFVAPRDGWETGTELRLAGLHINKSHMVVGGIGIVAGFILGRIL